MLCFFFKFCNKIGYVYKRFYILVVLELVFELIMIFLNVRVMNFFNKIFLEYSKFEVES